MSDTLLQFVCDNKTFSVHDKALRKLPFVHVRVTTWHANGVDAATGLPVIDADAIGHAVKQPFTAQHLDELIAWAYDGSIERFTAKNNVIRAAQWAVVADFFLSIELKHALERYAAHPPWQVASLWKLLYKDAKRACGRTCTPKFQRKLIKGGLSIAMCLLGVAIIAYGLLGVDRTTTTTTRAPDTTYGEKRINSTSEATRVHLECLMAKPLPVVLFEGIAYFLFMSWVLVAQMIIVMVLTLFYPPGSVPVIPASDISRFFVSTFCACGKLGSV